MNWKEWRELQQNISQGVNEHTKIKLSTSRDIDIK